MKSTPAEDEHVERLVAIAIAAVFHGLSNCGTRMGSADQLIASAKAIEKYIRTGE